MSCRFNYGDGVYHPVCGDGVISSFCNDKCGVNWINKDIPKEYIRFFSESELTSKPSLKSNEAPRAWCRPPVGVHKPYRK